MAEEITKMFFANLNSSDVDFIKKSSRSEDSRKHLEEKLIEYLKMWDGNDWVDDEKLWFLGFHLGDVWPPEHKDALKAVVQSSVGKPVSNHFFSGFNAVRPFLQG